MVFAALGGQGWRQVGELGLAFGLSALIGIERELRHKDAGLRTHTLVGVGAALFMLVSKYGFSDVLEPGRIIVDPSRVAAQIVTGIGFLGAGLIFVRRESVRGLTTAASIWVTAAIAAAAGAGLAVLAALSTGLYFLAALVLTLISHRLAAATSSASVLQVRYHQQRGVLRRLLQLATDEGFAIDAVSTAQSAVEGGDHAGGDGMVEVEVSVHGKRPGHQLAEVLTELEGVDRVIVRDVHAVDD